MTRMWFGAGVADWTFDTVDAVDGNNNIAQVVGGVEVTFWNTEGRGQQIIDLLDEDGQPVTAVTSSDGSDGRAAGTIPPVQGPDGVTEMWAAAGDGPPALLQGRLGSELAAVRALAQEAADAVADLLDAPSVAVPAVWHQDTVTAETGLYRYYNPLAVPLTLRSVVVSVGGNTPAGASIIVQVQVDGVPVFVDANRPTIAAGQRYSGLAATFAVSAWPPGSYLTASVIQGGSSTPGSKLTIQATAY